MQCRYAFSAYAKRKVYLINRDEYCNITRNLYIKLKRRWGRNLVNIEHWIKVNIVENNGNINLIDFVEEPHFNLGFICKALLCEKEAKLPVVINEIKKFINREKNIAIFIYQKENIISCVVRDLSKNQLIHIPNIRKPIEYKLIDKTHVIYQNIEDEDYFL